MVNMIKQPQLTVHHFQSFKAENSMADLRQNLVIASALKRRFPTFDVSVLGDFKQPWIEVNGVNSNHEKRIIEKSTVEVIAAIQVKTELEKEVIE